LNIWYLSAHDQPRGQSSRTYDFAKELVSLGHQVTMFTNSICHWTHVDCLGPHEKWRIENVEGIRVVWLKTFPYMGNGLRRGMNMVSNARRSLQVASKLSDIPDVVIGPSVPLGTGWAAHRIARAKGAAFVFEVRDVWPIALVDDGGMSDKSIIYFLFRYLEKNLYRYADSISSTLPFLFDHVRESGSNPEKITWIPNGADLARFAGYDHYNGGSNPLVVMYVGGFGQAHDVITIVRAASIMKQRGENGFRFVVIGDGPKKEECVDEVRHLGLDNVEFRNPVPKKDVPRIQTEADILVASVLDSKIYRFGLNLNKIYDYFASARPVVFSGKARNDPVIEAKAGFSVLPEDPLEMAEALLKIKKMTPQERIEIGQRGREYIEHGFDMSVLGKRMEKMLLDVVRKKGAK